MGATVTREAKPYGFYGVIVLAKWEDPAVNRGLVMRVFNMAGKPVEVNKFGFGHLGSFDSLEDAEAALLEHGCKVDLDLWYYSPDCPLIKMRRETSRQY